MKTKKNKISDTDKKSAREYPRFGALDFVIILVVVISIVGIYFRFNLVDTITQTANSKKYVVSFSIENIRYTTPNYVDIGDKLYISSSNEYLGEILAASDEMSNNALSVTPSSEVFIENGEYVEVYYPNSESRVDADGRFACEGTYTDSKGLIINNSTHITAGQTLTVQTELVTLVIEIMGIAPLE
jgi:hypothetical protein